jgi:hypothetical protein
MRMAKAELGLLSARIHLAGEPFQPSIKFID